MKNKTVDLVDFVDLVGKKKDVTLYIFKFFFTWRRHLRSSRSADVTCSCKHLDDLLDIFLSSLLFMFLELFYCSALEVQRYAPFQNYWLPSKNVNIIIRKKNFWMNFKEKSF